MAQIRQLSFNFVCHQFANDYQWCNIFGAWFICVDVHKDGYAKYRYHQHSVREIGPLVEFNPVSERPEYYNMTCVAPDESYQFYRRKGSSEIRIAYIKSYFKIDIDGSAVDNDVEWLGFVPSFKGFENECKTIDKAS